MRILVAVDQNPYSERVIRLVAALAKNTWAHVTLLGIASDTQDFGESQSVGALHDLAAALDGYRKQFLGFFITTKL